MKKLSIIIPCYNESKNLPLLISRCKEVANKDSNIEIIIVDNGSNDDTSSVLDELTSNLAFITRVKIEVNKGYGGGILAGLAAASGEMLSWTHADLQTDPFDLLKGLSLIPSHDNLEQVFIKGSRYGRPFFDSLFTLGMSIFETILMRKLMWDINAQPTMFHRNFFLTWKFAPDDFSLDLYAYYLALKSGLKVYRFPVKFSIRKHGVSHWNIDWKAKLKFIRRTINFSFELRKNIKT
jgi:glycosyltransferase involved in cell wall biosynthesis